MVCGICFWPPNLLASPQLAILWSPQNLYCPIQVFGLYWGGSKIVLDIVFGSKYARFKSCSRMPKHHFRDVGDSEEFLSPFKGGPGKRGWSYMVKPLSFARVTALTTWKKKIKNIIYNFEFYFSKRSRRSPVFWCSKYRRDAPRNTRPGNSQPENQRPRRPRPEDQRPRDPRPEDQRPEGGWSPRGRSPRGQSPGSKSPGGQNPRSKYPKTNILNTIIYKNEIPIKIGGQLKAWAYLRCKCRISDIGFCRLAMIRLVNYDVSKSFLMC